MDRTKFALFTVCVFVLAEAEEGYLRENPNRQVAYDRGYGGQNTKDIEEDLLDNVDGIPGVAGKDYPIFDSMPTTGFNCDQQLFPGYYADPEANCQVYHICQPDGRKDSFLCSNGTIFNQERLVCEWWHTVDCSQARAKYSVNEAITKAMAEIDRKTTERKAVEALLYKTSNSVVRGEVHDAQRPPQGYKANDNVSLEKDDSSYKHNRLSLTNYNNMETPQPYTLKRRDQITKSKFEKLSPLDDIAHKTSYLPTQ